MGKLQSHLLVKGANTMFSLECFFGEFYKYLYLQLHSLHFTLSTLTEHQSLTMSILSFFLVANPLNT